MAEKQGPSPEILKEHDRVELLFNIYPRRQAGDRGTIVHVYKDGTAYEVEFTEGDPEVMTVGNQDIRKI